MTVTALATLVVAGSLTWTVLYALSPFGPSGVSPARGLPADPCTVVSEELRDDLDAEVSSWSVSNYSSGCGWNVSMHGQDEVSLRVFHSVPMSEADAELAEELSDEDVPRDAETMYEDEVESAGELAAVVEGSTTEIVGTEEADLGLGDENVLVLADIAYEYESGTTQRVSVVVREGDVVSSLRVTLPSGGDDLDAAGAEELLTDVIADVFG
ncbi:hypothetical protein [Nocardiopsis lucentensis]|uniref:hypothetical protein n=1 Tax=Nocardiopsis lucentensis TaxID=53441 RepID=UPI000370620C|nr:hypothetical protein [Nocardiopsis lucentensis]